MTKQVGNVLNEQSLVAQIDWLTDLIWPDGKLFESRAAISDEEREEVKEEARRLLLASIPTGLRTLLGKEHCVAAVQKSAHTHTHKHAGSACVVCVTLSSSWQAVDWRWIGFSPSI